MIISKKTTLYTMIKVCIFNKNKSQKNLLENVQFLPKGERRRTGEGKAGEGGILSPTFAV